MDVGREAGHDDPALGVSEDLLEVGPYLRLARREPGTVGVGRVSAQEENALAAQLGQARDIGRGAVDRCLIELVVARHEDCSELCPNRHGARIGNRVGHVDELDGKGAERQLLAGLDILELRVAELVLVELGARHRDHQPAPVDRRGMLLAELTQHPGQCPEMVLVPVGDDDRLDLRSTLAQIAEVREHEIDPEHLGGREAKPGVDHDDPSAVLDDRHVLTDLAESAERKDAERFAHACTV